ncbi:hypothetical protein chiPu_0015347 [Chiloscyllium punctatum]|uniref:Uncharacterized protein n=1 Tax=Chiloscyllium punctatum TaxID=137246 RepID=A0A401T2N9_CHIPU|nr:hypothetical protein [Chiloscyllium punctatum]
MFQTTTVPDRIAAVIACQTSRRDGQGQKAGRNTVAAHDTCPQALRVHPVLGPEKIGAEATRPVPVSESKPHSSQSQSNIRVDAQMSLQENAASKGA